jgi:cold shock protein
VMDKRQGVVKWFNDASGYGFITSDAIDYFVHFKDIQQYGHVSLDDNEKVTFTAERTFRGLVAKNVIKL